MKIIKKRLRLASERIRNLTLRSGDVVGGLPITGTTVTYHTACPTWCVSCDGTCPNTAPFGICTIDDTSGCPA